MLTSVNEHIRIAVLDVLWIFVLFGPKFNGMIW